MSLRIVESPNYITSTLTPEISMLAGTGTGFEKTLSGFPLPQIHKP